MRFVFSSFVRYLRGWLHVNCAHGFWHSGLLVSEPFVCLMMNIDSAGHHCLKFCAPNNAAMWKQNEIHVPCLCSCPLLNLSKKRKRKQQQNNQPLGHLQLQLWLCADLTLDFAFLPFMFVMVVRRKWYALCFASSGCEWESEREKREKERRKNSEVREKAINRLFEIKQPGDYTIRTIQIAYHNALAFCTNSMKYKKTAHRMYLCSEREKKSQNQRTKAFQ